jgi:hypothetical protein
LRFVHLSFVAVFCGGNGAHTNKHKKEKPSFLLFCRSRFPLSSLSPFLSSFFIFLIMAAQQQQQQPQQLSYNVRNMHPQLASVDPFFGNEAVEKNYEGFTWLNVNGTPFASAQAAAKGAWHQQSVSAMTEDGTTVQTTRDTFVITQQTMQQLVAMPVEEWPIAVTAQHLPARIDEATKARVVEAKGAMLAITSVGFVYANAAGETTVRPLNFVATGRVPFDLKTEYLGKEMKKFSASIDFGETDTVSRTFYEKLDQWALWAAMSMKLKRPSGSDISTSDNPDVVAELFKGAHRTNMFTSTTVNANTGLPYPSTFTVRMFANGANAVMRDTDQRTIVEAADAFKWGNKVEVLVNFASLNVDAKTIQLMPIVKEGWIYERRSAGGGGQAFTAGIYSQVAVVPAAPVKPDLAASSGFAADANQTWDAAHAAAQQAGAPPAAANWSVPDGFQSSGFGQ